MNIQRVGNNRVAPRAQMQATQISGRGSGQFLDTVNRYGQGERGGTRKEKLQPSRSLIGNIPDTVKRPGTGRQDRFRTHESPIPLGAQHCGFSTGFHHKLLRTPRKQNSRITMDAEFERPIGRNVARNSDSNGSGCFSLSGPNHAGHHENVPVIQTYSVRRTPEKLTGFVQMTGDFADYDLHHAPRRNSPVAQFDPGHLRADVRKEDAQFPTLPQMIDMHMRLAVFISGSNDKLHSSVTGNSGHVWANE